MVNIEQLAINGGLVAHAKRNPPMYPGGMFIGEEEIEAVVNVLKSKKLFRYYGPDDTLSHAESLEKSFAELTNTKYALALNSCTNAIMISLLAAGVQPGDEVIVPAYTFVSPAAAIVGANAIPVIVEIDDSYTISPKAIEQNITEKTKAIIPVHMRGVPCDMDYIMDIAKRHHLKVIEDVAQANGGFYKGRPLGSIGDMGCFSFQFNKVITAGEGGMITTNNKILLNRAKALHDVGHNGRRKSPVSCTSTAVPLFTGYNCRINEVSAAILEIQLNRRKNILEVLRLYASKIKTVIAEYSTISPRRIYDEQGDIGVCVMFSLENRELVLKVVDALVAEGISASSIGSKAIYDLNIYTYWSHILQKKGNNDSNFPFTLSEREYSVNMCPITLDLLRRTVHLDVNPLYTDADVKEIIHGLKKVFNFYL
jgi:dTDP-4-amino-4,6-dideoxygalactose transaminase